MAVAAESDLQGLYDSDTGDADGAATVYYVLCDICGKGISADNYCDTGVWI